MKRSLFLTGMLATVLALSLVIVGCGDKPGDGNGGDPDLEGTITISPNTNVTTGTELTATYSGTETVSYQWKKDDNNVGTDSNKYTPTEAGSYTVTVSAEGYKSKTSTAVTVTEPTYTVTFNSNGGSAISPITGLTSGAKIVEPAAPTKTADDIFNYTFGSWYKEEELTNAWNFTTDSVTGTITLYAKWTSTLKYDLGDTGPGGGIIFYCSATGFTMTDDNSTAHYLEAAPEDMSTRLAWASSTFISTSYGGTGDFIFIDDTETGIGMGRKNTSLILATDADAPAAKACNEYSNNGKTDWFLPSYDELDELYINRNFVDNLEIKASVGDYWSSLQHDTNFDWAVGQNFSNSIYHRAIDRKNSTLLVRAVRAF